MITDGRAQEIALFFLFSLLDQKVALQAAHKAIAQAKALPEDANSTVDIARILKRGFDAHRKILARNQPVEISDGAILFPAGTDLATWQKFHLQSSDAEITAVVLTKVLGYQESEIAEAFSVSVGTMKYRVAKGMKQLGSVLRQPSAPPQGSAQSQGSP